MSTHNILVVDDEVSNLNALARALRREYNVFSATNGRDALAIIEENDITLTIADHRMPGMTGIEFLEKTLQKYPNIIRIILTSYTDEKLLMDAINKVHAHGYIVKPWEPEEVRFVVRKWIATYLKEQTEQREKDRQIEDLQRQLEQSQRLLEPHKTSWWKRWFGRTRKTKGKAR